MEEKTIVVARPKGTIGHQVVEDILFTGAPG
jgi:hypothetical protein